MITSLILSINYTIIISVIMFFCFKGMYPPQGMSPHNNMVLQQVMHNNPQGRVMSPSQQQQQPPPPQTNGGGMMSPHPHLMNPQQPQQQQPPPQMGGPMMPQHLQQPNGPMPPGKYGFT